MRPWTSSIIAVLLIADRAPAQTTNRCAIADATVPTAGSELFSQDSGGTAIAKFTGALISLQLDRFPNDPSTRRVQVTTGDGKMPYLRIKGWAPGSSFRYFAKQSVALVPNHVWLTKGLELRVVAVKDDVLEIEHAVLGTRGSDGAPMKLKGSIACGSVALAPPSIDRVEPPKSARMFHMKKDELALYDKPQGEVVFTLKMDEHARKLFWSTEMRAGWARVTSPGDVIIDAWARTSDLEPLVRGEVFDMSSLEPRPLAPKTLALQEPPAVLTASSELSISAKAEASAPAIGLIEAGARFYAMEVSTQWTSVVPTDLAVMPVDGGGFWVKTSTLPKQ
jgi:hypothetical protein